MKAIYPSQKYFNVYSYIKLDFITLFNLIPYQQQREQIITICRYH